MKIIRISPSLRGASAAAAVSAAAALMVTAAPVPAAAADTTWTVRPAPFTLGTSSLIGVSATGPDSVWIGGYQWYSSRYGFDCLGAPGPCTVTRHQNPTLQQWTGGGWSWASTPGLPGNGNIKFVDATSAADAWAAGSRDQPDGTTEGTPYLARATAGNWSEVPTPSTLRVIEALDGDEEGAWVTGVPVTPGGPSVYRYASGGWVPHTLGGPIQGIGQRTPEDVWAVGRTTGGLAHAARYDGVTWHTMTPPQVEGMTGRFKSVLPLAADDVWVTGTVEEDSGFWKNASYHWNGSTWREDVLPPGASFGGDHYFGYGPDRTNANYSPGGLIDDGAGGLWAVTPTLAANDSPRILRYTGGSWRVVEPAPGIKGKIHGITRVPGTDTVWAVGVRDMTKPLVLSTD